MEAQAVLPNGYTRSIISIRDWDFRWQDVYQHQSPLRLPKGTTWNSRGLIDACRPYEILKDFPPVVKASAELRAQVAQKFRRQLERPPK